MQAVKVRLTVLVPSHFAFIQGNLQPREEQERTVNRKTIPPRILIAAACAAFCSTAPALAQLYMYTPAQIRTAYGFNGITFNGVPATGAGETIAIVDAYSNPTIQSDLSTFDSQFGINAPPSFSIENQTGGSTLPPAPPPSQSNWLAETDIDVEWAHAIAPQANILLVETNDNVGLDLYAGADGRQGRRHVCGLDELGQPRIPI